MSVSKSWERWSFRMAATGSAGAAANPRQAGILSRRIAHRITQGHLDHDIVCGLAIPALQGRA